MSKAYEDTMLTLTLTGAVFKIMQKTFCIGAKFENEALYNEVQTLYQEIRIITKKWPHQNNNKTVKAIIDKTNTIIRNNKHLQGRSIFVTTLMSLIIARMGDLYIHVNGIKKDWIGDILSKMESFNLKIESVISNDKDLEDQYEIGAKIYDDLS